MFKEEFNIKSTKGSGSWVLGFWVLGFWVLGPGFWFLGSGSWIQVPGTKYLNLAPST